MLQVFPSWEKHEDSLGMGSLLLLTQIPMVLTQPWLCFPCWFIPVTKGIPDSSVLGAASLGWVDPGFAGKWL